MDISEQRYIYNDAAQPILPQKSKHISFRSGFSDTCHTPQNSNPLLPDSTGLVTR